MRCADELPRRVALRAAAIAAVAIGAIALGAGGVELGAGAIGAALGVWLAAAGWADRTPIGLIVVRRRTPTADDDGDSSQIQPANARVESAREYSPAP